MTIFIFLFQNSIQLFQFVEILKKAILNNFSIGLAHSSRFVITCMADSRALSSSHSEKSEISVYSKVAITVHDPSRKRVVNSLPHV